MKNKHLALIIIVVVSIIAIFSVFSFYYVTSQIANQSIEMGLDYDDSQMKNETFGKINMSVPADATFKNTDPSNNYYGESFESSNNMIFVESYSENFNSNDIENLIFEGFKDNNYTKTDLKGLSQNANAYTDPKYDDIIYIVVTNENKNQGIVLTVVDNQDLAIKMANSVVFSN